MTFLTLLTKEMRLRLRRERTIWIIMLYVLLLGLLGWLSLSNDSNYTNPLSTTLSNAGLDLYGLLANLQLFLIIVITPAFTATAINSEKERQTYDMLLCSQLSPLSLITGKLLAGLASALLLIAAAIPLFSLVFFFGGIAPAQVLSSLVVFIVTTFLMGTFGLFCSTVLQRPAVSTAIAYTTGLLWTLLPLMISFVIYSSNGARFFATHPNSSRLLFLWNPINALLSTYPSTGSNIFAFLLGYGMNGGYNTNGTGPTAPYAVLSYNLPPWALYSLISIFVTAIFFLLSLAMVRPDSLSRLQKKTEKPITSDQAEVMA